LWAKEHLPFAFKTSGLIILKDYNNDGLPPQSINLEKGCMVLHPKTGPSRRSPEKPLNRLFRAVRHLLTQCTGTFLPRFASIHKNSREDRQRLATVDKRKNPRIHLAETTVHVTDGCLFATALIDNISLCGICLCNLPEQLYRSARQLTVFSSENPGMPILHIQPQWEDTSWDGKTIGATILNTSETWRLFLVQASSRMDS
jgi:hypothetical protein